MDKINLLFSHWKCFKSIIKFFSFFFLLHFRTEHFSGEHAVTGKKGNKNEFFPVEPFTAERMYCCSNVEGDKTGARNNAEA